VATILFYSPFNNRSRDTESLMLAFKDKGDQVISLSQAEGKYIHPFLRANGIETYSHVINRESDFIYHLRHIVYFILFCYRNKVNVVYAHLESACFVASIAQYFVSAKVFICRHHINEAALQGFDKSIYYRLTYKLARKIIVVSKRAAEYMEQVEHVKRDKIITINLAYDFDLYPAPDTSEVIKIKSLFQADMLFLTVGRLTAPKRVNLSIEVLKKLVDDGINAKLIILGSGDEREILTNRIALYNLQDRVGVLGFVQNVQDYLAASDCLLHPSILESSCVIVKEAGLQCKPVIVCKGIGDFDEYIVDKQNGFLVSVDNFVLEAVDCIKTNLVNESLLQAIGNRLSSEIRRRFAIEKIIPEYHKLNNR
jgi:glycosyltransferase involved in cell wall biosynthesis